MPSDFPRHHRSTSPNRAEVLMVVLVTIASVVVCGWIAVWPLSDVGAAWLGAVAGLPVAMLPASIGTSSCGGIDGVQPQATAPRTSSRFSALGHPSRNVRSCRGQGSSVSAGAEPY